MTIWVHQHIGGLEIEMTGVLLVQAVRRARNGGAHARNVLCTWAGACLFVLVQNMLQRVAAHMFHHQIRQSHQVACCYKAWHMTTV